MNGWAPITLAALALPILAGNATAQHRPTATWRPPTTTWQPSTGTWRRPTSIWQRPNPQAHRPMGVPASVQPSGQPHPAPPGCWSPCRPPGVAPVYFYPVPVPHAYPAALAWPGTYGPGARGADLYGGPQTRRPPVLTMVETAPSSPRVEVRRFVPDRAAGCALVEIRMAGERWSSPVPLPSLGADTHAALFRTLSERLATGRQVPLVTLNGTRIMLAGGPGISGLRVEPCDGAGSAPTDGDGP